MSDRREKMGKELQKIAAAFIAENSNRNSMITVTRFDLSPDFRNATVYVTVFPTEQESAALLFLQRRSTDLRDAMKKSLKTKIVPNVDIKIDEGEKNRQRIDELLNE
jgi:ribosome-binding factor A